METVLVYVRVKPEYVNAFIEATLKNASSSVQEQGISRFDVIQQQDDPTRFVLVEVYKNIDAPGRHKESAHYQIWRDTVTEMMADPRAGVKYNVIFPQPQSE
ncbi:MAG: antibiotic biosynthesis monooxygenase [Chloroflexi bacterium]|nr:MAG: antibiotic biosynthesis monooxygenase [Chloroflexota bacterium]